jgi:hypothetical protein
MMTTMSTTTEEEKMMTEEEEDESMKMDVEKPKTQLSFMDELMYYLPEDDYDCHVCKANYDGDRIYSVIHTRVWQESDHKDYELESYEGQPDAIFTFIRGYVLYRRICTNPRKLFHNTGYNKPLEILVPADTIIPTEWELLNPGSHTILYPFNGNVIQMNYGNDYMIIQAQRRITN